MLSTPLGATRRLHPLWYLALLSLIVGALSAATFASPQAHAATLPGVPAGFAKTQLAQGLKNPSVFAFAPNGDIYIGEKGGAILIYRNGVVLPTPLVTLPTDGAGEKGLLGMALDPNFATNGYLYVSYTTTDEHAELARLTVQNDTVNLASEVVYMKGNQLQNAHHSANDLHIGPDGKLWWSVGDNVPSITNAETLSNIYGKILRFNLDGTIPSDNPFRHIPGAVPAIYAYGLRNPFRFTFLPTGQAMTEDTGSSYWEEMDTIQRGGNYGWDFVEGNCGSCGYINPAYAYGHLPTDGAASAIAAYSGTAFPAQYAHVVFFGDYNRGDIEAVAFDPTYKTEISDTVFDSSAGTIADLQEGPDGALYYVSIFEGTFTKIAAVGPFTNTPPTVPSPNPNAPVATITTPALGATYNGGDTISFSGTAKTPANVALAASDFTWQVDFYSNGVAQPFYTNEVPHPFAGPFVGVTSGSFTIPQDLSNTASTFYRITLTVTDGQGNITVKTRDIRPNKTHWSVTTNIPGANYVVDGMWETAPYAIEDGVGVQHVLTGVPVQMIGATRYRFRGWADGSAITDSFTTTAASQTFTADYDAVTSTLPAPWQTADIGAPLVPGATDYSASDGTFFVDGAGADVFGAHDQFRYVYQTLNGDGTIVARVLYQTNSSPWAKAGVMIKQAAVAGSPFVDALVTPNVSPNTPNINGIGCNPNGCASPLPPITPTVGYGLRMQYTTTGSQSVTAPVSGFSFPNEWLKLTRVGTTFTSWYSTDGVNWIRIGVTHLTMTNPVTIGLFVTSHNIGQTSTVAFDNVSVTPLP
jgi:glucose/arabinose dehydrogenase